MAVILNSEEILLQTTTLKPNHEAVQQVRHLNHR